MAVEEAKKRKKLLNIIFQPSLVHTFNPQLRAPPTLPHTPFIGVPHLSSIMSLSSYPVLPYSPDKSLRIVILGAGGFIASHLARRLFNQRNNDGIAPHTIICADWKRNEHMKVRFAVIGARKGAGGRVGKKKSAKGQGRLVRSTTIFRPSSAGTLPPPPTPQFAPQCVRHVTSMPSRGSVGRPLPETRPPRANANGSNRERPRASAGRREDEILALPMHGPTGLETPHARLPTPSAMRRCITRSSECVLFGCRRPGRG